MVLVLELVLYINTTDGLLENQENYLKAFIGIV
jgi:hypothetical protein